MFYNYNPLQNTQQRLAQYEQLQQQFQQPQFNSYQSQPQPQQQLQQAAVKVRAVTSLEEARSAMIEFDGCLNIFTDIANGKIYTKQINLDGNAVLNVYKLDKTPTNTGKENIVTRSEFEELKTQVEKYGNILSELEGGSKDE